MNYDYITMNVYNSSIYELQERWLVIKKLPAHMQRAGV